MKKLIDRRKFMASSLGLGALTLFSPSVASGYFEEIDSSEPSKYKVYRTNQAYTKPKDKGSINIWYRNPGGLLSGNQEFDPEWFLYFTSNESNNLTYLHNTKPSVGFNPFLRNGYRIRASAGNGNGQMCIDFLPHCLTGGFYEGNNPNNGTIRDDIQRVSVSVDKGEMSCSKMPHWRNPFPLMVWENNSSGTISTGNVYIKIENGRFRNISERGIAPLIMGATPLYVRGTREPRDVFIQRSGRTERRNNPDF